jgi:hypothetical protein
MTASRHTSGFEQSLRNAEQALCDAQGDLSIWADDIRQSAEKRLGVGVGDMRALDDPTYDRALRLYPSLKRLVEEVSGVAAEYQAIVKMNEDA